MLAAILAAAPMERFASDGALFLSLPEVAPAQSASNDAEAYARALKSHLATGVLKSASTAGYVVLDLPGWARRF